MALVQRDDNPAVLTDFLMYLSVVRGRTIRTVSEYQIDLRLFLKYVKFIKGKSDAAILEDTDIRDVDAALLRQVDLHDIYEFEFFLQNERGNNGRSRARKTSAIKGFFKYLTHNVHLIDKNPAEHLELPSTEKPLPKFLTLEESLRMLRSAEQEDSKYALRDYCILTLFLNCGLRLSELVGINKNDIDLGERRMRVRGKGRKERMLYLNDACIDAITEYLSSRENPEEEPHALFLSRNSRRISRRRVQQVVEQTLSNAELDGKGLSTHKLRHTAATLMYQHGNVDTLTLKEILGHQSIATTEIYTHLADERKQEAMENNPLAAVHNRRTTKKQEG